MRTAQDILENMEELINGQKKEIASLKEQLKEAEWVLVKFVPHKDTIQWDSREKLARDYFKRATQARREK